MDFRYTKHISEKLRDREIEIWMIQQVLDSPRWQIPVTRGNRYDGVVNGRRLCVVISEDDLPALVTAWWYEGDRE